MMPLAWSGLTAMISNVDRIASGDGLRKVAMSLGQQLDAAYVAGHKWNNVTGALEISSGVDIQVTGSAIILTLYTGEYYGWFLEAGTKYVGQRYSSIMPVIYVFLPSAVSQASAAFLGG